MVGAMKSLRHEITSPVRDITYNPEYEHFPIDRNMQAVWFILDHSVNTEVKLILKFEIDYEIN